jgi:hypothetical protein
MERRTTNPIASRDSGAVVGGVGVAPHEQPQLFSTPQTTRTSDDYWTPRWVFDTLGVTFDLDVACPPGGAPWVPATRYYTQAEDGLTSPWFGRVWMNPPYSNTTPWVTKFMQHKNGIALLPLAKSKWFNHIWADNNAIVLMDSALKFTDPKGGNGSIFIATCLVAYGQDNIKAIQRVGRVR